MLVTINGQQKTVPFSLEDITLSQFIDYYHKYGKDLDKELDEILKRDYKKDFPDANDEQIEFIKSIDLDNQLDHEAIAWYSYWLGLEPEESANITDTQSAITQYRVLKYLLLQDEENAKDIATPINWKDETWTIQNYTVNSASNMTVNEVVTSKELMSQIVKMELSRWDAMPYLCAIFLRKQGEPFKDELVHEDSNRIKLMMELPMIHVLKVAFFLSICVNIWKNTSQFSTVNQ